MVTVKGEQAGPQGIMGQEEAEEGSKYGSGREERQPLLGGPWVG